MAEILWEPEAQKNYKKLMEEDPKKGRLHLLQREQLKQRIDALRDWPPKKWFDLRSQADGYITFQTEGDQFVVISGGYEEGAVKITFFEIRKKGRK